MSKNLTSEITDALYKYFDAVASMDQQKLDYAIQALMNLSVDKNFVQSAMEVFSKAFFTNPYKIIHSDNPNVQMKYFERVNQQVYNLIKGMFTDDMANLLGNFFTTLLFWAEYMPIFYFTFYLNDNDPENREYALNGIRAIKYVAYNQNPERYNSFINHLSNFLVLIESLSQRADVAWFTNYLLSFFVNRDILNLLTDDSVVDYANPKGRKAVEYYRNYLNTYLNDERKVQEFSQSPPSIGTKFSESLPSTSIGTKFSESLPSIGTSSPVGQSSELAVSGQSRGTGQSFTFDEPSAASASVWGQPTEFSESEFDLESGRYDLTAANLFFVPFKEGTKLGFRSPQDSIRKYSKNFFLRKPLVYLAGNDDPQLDWRGFFVPLLRGSFYIFNPNVTEATHHRSKAKFDDFVANVAILSADVIIFYIDFWKRNLSVLTEAIFYINTGFPVILILQNLQKGTYAESRDEINQLREHLRQIAILRNVPVYKTFSDFAKQNVDRTSGKLSPDRLLSLVSKNLISSGLVQVGQNFVESVTPDFKDKIDSVFFSKKPITQAIQVDVEDTLIQRDKSFSLSVLNTIMITEYWAILLFLTDNKLGISSFNSQFNVSSDIQMQINSDFMRIKKELQIKELDMTFYDNAENYLDEINTFLNDQSISGPYSIEIQLTMNVLVQNLRESMGKSYLQERDYLTAVKKDKLLQSYFKSITLKSMNVDSLTEAEILAEFAKTYVRELIQDVNDSRMTLQKFVSLYPNVLSNNVVLAFESLCKFYRYSYNKATGILYVDGFEFHVTNYGYLVYLNLLEQYFNGFLMRKGQPGAQMVARR